MLRLEMDAWSMVKRLRQATNEYAPPSPKTSDFVQPAFHGCSTREKKKDAMKKKSSTLFLGREGLSHNDVAVAWDNILQEIRPEVGSNSGDFVEKILGGYRKTTRGSCMIFLSLPLVGTTPEKNI